MNFDWNKKVGPLPLWAWVGVVGIGLIFSYYTYNKNGGFTKTPEEPIDVENTSPVPGVGLGGMGWQTVNPPATPGKPTVETNEQWGKLATDDLIASGFDPALVDKAIRNYLGGNPLSQPEQSVINIALRKYGAPPTALPPVINPPSDGGDEDDPFRNIPEFVYIGASAPGRTSVRDITREFYGSDDLDAKVQSVWAWNWDQVQPKNIDPNNLPHGTIIRLPRWGPYAPADPTRGMRIKHL